MKFHIQGQESPQLRRSAIMKFHIQGQESPQLRRSAIDGAMHVRRQWRFYAVEELPILGY